MPPLIGRHHFKETFVADKRDYYEILGVTKGAGEDELKKAYRRLAKQFHPDVNQDDPEAEHKFKEISEAYEVLSDSNKRARYDQFGHNDPSAGGTGGFGGFGGFGGVEDIFESFFSGFGGSSSRRNGPRKGADIREHVTIEFKEAAFGVKKSVNVLRHEHCPECEGSGAKAGTKPEQCGKCKGTGRVRVRQNTLFGQFVNEQTCDACSGSGKIIKEHCTNCRGSGRVRKTRKIDINVPAGIDNGHTISLRGEGEPGTLGGPAGDLLVTVRVKSHKEFIRNGTNIHLKISVSFAQAALGAELEISTIDGKVKYKMHEGTQSGDKFRMRNKGMPSLRTGNRGDQIVEVFVEVPTKLNKKQKAALKEYAVLMGEEKKSRK